MNLEELTLKELNIRKKKSLSELEDIESEFQNYKIELDKLIEERDKTIREIRELVADIQSIKDDINDSSNFEDVKLSNYVMKKYK